MLISATLALGGPAAADSAKSSDRDGFVQAMTQQHDAMQGAGGARLAELARGVRPKARSDAAVTVATRNLVDGPLPTAAASRQSASRALAAAAAGTRIDVSTLDALPPARGDAQWSCLATAIYFEARGEPIAGQIAVAEVVLNRVDSPAYPKTVCGVTNQGASGRGCQFSYACDGRPERMAPGAARDRAEKLAALMLAGRARTVADGATHFHTRAVRPGWAGQMTRTAAIGHHLFYR